MHGKEGSEDVRLIRSSSKGLRGGASGWMSSYLLLLLHSANKEWDSAEVDLHGVLA